MKRAVAEHLPKSKMPHACKLMLQESIAIHIAPRLQLTQISNAIGFFFFFIFNFNSKIRKV